MSKNLFYIVSPFLKVFLWFLNKLFVIRRRFDRKKIQPKFPYDKKAKKIALPGDVEKELFQLAKQDKLKAMKRVIELTGADLRISKNYVDKLLAKGRK